MSRARPIFTDRLRLCPPKAWDVAGYLRLISNQQVRRYLGGPVPARAWPGRARSLLIGHPDAPAWIVRRRKGGGPIGLVSLNPHRDGGVHELSYEFHPESWGRGLASEAVGAVLHEAQMQFELRELIAETQAKNTRSCRLLIALGFTEQRRVQRFGAEQIVFHCLLRNPADQEPWRISDAPGQTDASKQENTPGRKARRC